MVRNGPPHGYPWQRPTNLPRRMAEVAVVLPHAIAGPAVWLFYGSQIGPFWIWVIVDQMSFLAAWSVLREGAKPQITLAVLVLYALAVFSAESGHRELSYAIALMLAAPAAFFATAIGFKILRDHWWRPSFPGKAGASGTTFSLYRLLAWTTVLAAMMGAVRWLREFGSDSDLASLYSIYLTMSLAGALFAVLAAAWIAPRGWIAKLLVSPVVLAASAGIVGIEIYSLGRFAGSWTGFVIVIAVYASLWHGAAFAITFLVLHASGLFAVPSVFGGESLDARLAARWNREAR